MKILFILVSYIGAITLGAYLMSEQRIELFNWVTLISLTIISGILSHTKDD